MEKPLIKHCGNCMFSTELPWSWEHEFYCDVKYKKVKQARISALLCPYFKPEEEREGD